MATLNEVLLPFAKSIYAKAEALKLELTKSQRSRFLEAISDDIKKCSNFVTPEVSRAASEQAAMRRVDLTCKTWHDQPAFDPGRSIFHFEHMVPVSTIRGACIEASSESAILEILKGRLRVAWILKSEDAELCRLGFRSERVDPEEAYRLARIALVASE